MLRAFPLAKIAQHYAEKYIKDNGCQDALIEAKIFQIKVVESVFDGTSSIRSLKILLIISEVIHSFH